MRYKLSIVRIFVTEWERAVRFYTETSGILLGSPKEPASTPGER
ncbi:MAG TPA: hypothetical protein VIJ73_22040 [Methylomirabilota bacterium]